MHKSVAVIAESDSNFFHHLAGMILSIKDKPQGGNLDICLFDLGLSEPQKRWLAKYVARIVDPGWVHPPVPGLPAPFKTIYAIPHIPEFFPGYETYVHIDADAWVQDFSAVDLLIRGANASSLAIVPEVERSFCSQYHYAKGFRQFVRDCYEQIRGPKAAEAYGDYPMLNTGVFAMRGDSPYWDAWREQMALSLSTPPNFMMTQTSLNLAVYERMDGDHPKDVQLLPILCNWTCYMALPVYDEERRLLVEPYLPHHPIGIVHRNSEDLRKREVFTVRTVQGNTARMNLKYREGDYCDALTAGAREITTGWGDMWWRGEKSDLDIKDY
jgi:hypothetical protein